MTETTIDAFAAGAHDAGRGSHRPEGALEVDREHALDLVVGEHRDRLADVDAGRAYQSVETVGLCVDGGDRIYRPNSTG